MYQGPMAKPVSVSAPAGSQVVTFGPFDPGDEISSVVLQVHSVGASLAVLLVQMELRAGSSIPSTFGGGRQITGGAFEAVSPVAFDGLINVPVNLVVRQREVLVIILTDDTGTDDVAGLIGIVFRGGVSNAAGGSNVSGGGNGGPGGNGTS